jgi:hypothetical protein
MPKYLIKNPDNPEEVLLKDSEEAREVAFDLASGANPEEYGIDAFEASMLICFVHDAAKVGGYDDLVASCKKALDRLMPDTQLLAIQIEKEDP